MFSHGFATGSTLPELSSISDEDVGLLATAIIKTSAEFQRLLDTIADHQSRDPTFATRLELAGWHGSAKSSGTGTVAVDASPPQPDYYEVNGDFDGMGFSEDLFAGMSGPAEPPFDPRAYSSAATAGTSSVSSDSPHQSFLQDFHVNGIRNFDTPPFFETPPSSVSSFSHFPSHSHLSDSDADRAAGQFSSQSVGGSSTDTNATATTINLFSYEPPQHPIPSSHRRFSSSSSVPPRFNPLARHLSPSLLPTTSPSLPLLSDLSLISPATSMLPYPLSRSASTSASPGVSRTTSLQRNTSSRAKGTEGKPKGAGGKTRSPSAFNYDPNQQFPLNTGHEFFVHAPLPIQAGKKTSSSERISEKTLTRLYLMPQTSNPTSTLGRAQTPGAPYTREDCIKDNGTYLFGDDHSRTWIVTYGSGLSTSIQPVVEDSSAPIPPRTFLHFPPGTMVESGTHSPGSVAWWRIQACTASVPHDGMPGDGSWTARYDANQTLRRPARIVLHYFDCKLHGCEGDFVPLRKLARAIHETKC